MKIFDNKNQLMRSVILRRLQTLDASADCSPYKHVNADPEAGPVGRTTYYVGVESTLTDAQIAACLGPIEQADTDAESAELTRAEKLRTLAEWLRIEPKDVREKFKDATDAFLALKARYDKLEAWAQTKGYIP